MNWYVAYKAQMGVPEQLKIVNRFTPFSYAGLAMVHLKEKVEVPLFNSKPVARSTKKYGFQANR
jgi:hypothetical protein